MALNFDRSDWNMNFKFEFTPDEEKTTGEITIDTYPESPVKTPGYKELLNHKKFGGISNERDLRGRLKIFDNNNSRLKVKPSKRLDECFEVQNTSWGFEVIIVATGEKVDMITASGTRERDFRKEHQDGKRYGFQ